MVPAPAGGDRETSHDRGTIMNRRQVLITTLSLVGLGAAGCARHDSTEEEHIAGPPVPLFPSLTADLFRPGTRHLLGAGGMAVSEVVRAGVLRLPTGRLTIADPSWASRTQPDKVVPLTVTVPPGAYPLTLALLDETVAAARLTIVDKPVTSWDLALREGENPADLRPGFFYGVGVDSGTLAMFDEAAHATVGGRVDEQLWSYDVEEETLSLEVRDVVPGANVIEFISGYGDGEYPVWVGRTRDGAVGCFMVDMQLLAPPTTTTAQPWLAPSHR
jgi:hypothetical protein